MKITIVLIIAALTLTFSAKAQTTNAPTISSALGELYAAIASSGLATATNYAFEPYLTYAPDAPSKNKIGGGIFIAYNLDKYVSSGLGFDYQGQLSLVSANVELKVPLHPFKSLTMFSGALTNIAIVPFGIGGLGKALGGTSSGAIAVTDAGAYIGFGHLWGGNFNVGAAWGRWDNAGAYSGVRYHGFIGWAKGF
jgi:hypothetical protein